MKRVAKKKEMEFLKMLILECERDIYAIVVLGYDYLEMGRGLYFI